MTSEERNAIDNLTDEVIDEGRIPVEGEFDDYRKNDLSDNYNEIK